ncbi:MAG: TonB family protein [Candidatus Eisenbacteria bacterium]
MTIRQAVTSLTLLLTIFGVGLASGDDQGIQLSIEVPLNIEVPRDGIYLGEPLIVRVSLRNTGTDTLWLEALFDPPRGLTDFEITGPEGDIFNPGGVIHEMQLVWTSGRGSDVVAPGDSVYGFVTLMHFAVRAHDGSGPVDHMTGKYGITAAYKFYKLRATSNHAEFIVREPPVDQVAACRAFVSAHPPDRTVLFPASDEWPPGNQAAYQQVVTKWPQSVYAKHALYYLAWITEHLTDCETAARHYQVLLSDYEGSPYAEMAEINLADCGEMTPEDRLELLRSLPDGRHRNVKLHGLVKRLERRIEMSRPERLVVERRSMPPEVLWSPEPIYPDSAITAGIQGIVKLMVTVDETGRVIKAWVVRSDVPALNGAAIEAAYRYRFTPATLDYRNPIQLTTSLNIEFTLPE